MQPDTPKITPRDLKKTPTGIQGFDEITLGGLPDGRPTLVRKLPPPVRKIIGDLSNTNRVLIGLDLVPENGRGLTGDTGTL